MRPQRILKPKTCLEHIKSVDFIVNSKYPKAKTIAITGDMGSGKTTAVIILQYIIWLKYEDKVEFHKFQNSKAEETNKPWDPSIQVKRISQSISSRGYPNLIKYIRSLGGQKTSKRSYFLIDEPERYCGINSTAEEHHDLCKYFIDTVKKAMKDSNKTAILISHNDIIINECDKEIRI